MMAGVPGGRISPRGVLVTSSIAVFLIALNTTAINAAVNALADDLGMDTSALAWALNAYILAVATLVLPAGRLGDILGMRSVFLIGMALFAAGTLLTAVAQDGDVLIGGRALQGAGAAFLMPATISVLNLAFPPQERGSAFGTWGAAAGIGFALGPLYGGVWTDGVSWRGIYWTDLAMIAVVVVLSLLYLGPLPRQARAPRLDLVGAAVLGVAILLFISALQRGQDVGWGTVSIVGSLVAGAVLAVVFVIIELRRAEPMVHLRLLRNRVYAAGNLVTLLSTIGLIGFLFFFNLYAQSEATFGYSAVAASLVLLPYGVSLFVTSLVAGRLGDRIGYPIPVGGGLVLLTIGAVLFATIDDVTSLGDLWLPLVISGVGLGSCFATASASPMSVVPPEQSGEAAGTLNVSRYIGGALSVAVGGTLFIGRGIDAMNDALADAGVTGVAEEKLDAALTGSPAGLEAAIDASGGEAQRALVSEAARTGMEAGFAAACWMIAIASTLGAAIAFWGLRRPR